MNLDALCRIPTPASNDRGGPFDALANYWIARIEAENDTGPAVPEWNLHGSAGESLCKLIGCGILSQTVAFDLGLEVARILYHKPMDAKHEVHAAIARAVEDMAGADVV